MLKDKRKIIIMGLLFILAVFARLVYLGETEILGDEPAYSVRSIGLLDVSTNVQETPIDWFDELPFWTSLSFHDHPPLTFFINNFFIKFFGDSLMVTRLPSALFSIFTIFLVYLITKKLFKDEYIAFFASALFAVNAISIFYARSAMMESFTLFFILLTFYLFLMSLENKKLLPFFGLSFGLSVLSKYVALGALPLYLLILLIYKREYFKDFYLYISWIVALFVVSPVIIYNIYLFKAIGHFDVQFSFLFGQETPEWSWLSGKVDRGSLWDRIKGYLIIFKVYSPFILLLSALGIGYLSKNFKLNKKNYLTFLLFSVVYLLTPFLFGSSPRFLFYLVPFIVIFAAYSLKFLLEKKDLNIFLIVALIVFIFESFYSFNTHLANIKKIKPLGNMFVHAGDLILPDVATNKLHDFLDKETMSKRPTIIGRSDRPAINPLKEKFREKYKENEPYDAVFVYDGRIATHITRWIFTKKSIYESWIFMDTDSMPTFLTPILSKKDDVVIYYIHSTKYALRRQWGFENVHPDSFREVLVSSGVEVENIYNNKGEIIFEIFKLKSSVLKNIIINNQ
jgi:ABC-type multidrug transport system fused ATPase/permease subunit